MPDFVIPYTPQERQKLLHGTTARQILYGGAAGGGKSVACRWDCVLFALRNPGFVGGIFRRTLPELRRTHINPIKFTLPNEICKWNEEQKTFYFYNNSIIMMGFCEHDDDVQRYLSEEFHALYLDEASLFTPTQIALLLSRLRLGGWKPQNESDAKHLPRIVYATNPGGPSHSLLKRTMIDPAPAETIFMSKDPDYPDDPGIPSIYIPAKMTDNKYLDQDYTQQFAWLSPEKKKAYREGDWDVVVGQAVHNLDRTKHQVRRFIPPKHWTRFMVIDWGTAAPFSVGWYCVSEGSLLKNKPGYNYEDVWLPAGALIRYAEFYGWNGKENKGLGWSGQHVAYKIKELELERNEPEIAYRVGDTEMWANRGGVAVSDQFQNLGMVLRKSIKDRKRNYSEVISRLAGNPNYTGDGETFDEPMLFITENCTHFWRTVPVLTLDETDPDKGPQTYPKQEDHVYDELAYACRSYPFITTLEDYEEEEYAAELEQYYNSSVDPYATG